MDPEYSEIQSIIIWYTEKRVRTHAKKNKTDSFVSWGRMRPPAIPARNCCAALNTASPRRMLSVIKIMAGTYAIQWTFGGSASAQMNNPGAGLLVPLVCLVYASQADSLRTNEASSRHLKKYKHRSQLGENKGDQEY
jgi:hypothetical protein